MTYEEIKENKDKASKLFDDFKKSFDKTWNFDRPYNDYYKELYGSKEYKEFDKWNALEKLNRVPTMKVAKDFDLKCRMTFEDFMESVKSSCITDWDGFGYYGNENEVSNIAVDCEQMYNGKYRKDFPYIYWYNK